ncbi:MAG: MATE family efflux transporter [Candidatus Merdisoma sp.]|jgi:Na+-driven multidrug efflux pump
MTLKIISIAVGLAAGCIPIVGYNIGAGQKNRAKHLFTCLLLTEAAVGAVATLIAELFPGQLIGIFGAANESSYYTGVAVKAFRIYLCTMTLASTLLSMVREVLFGVGFALLLPLFFGLDGVLYSMPVSDVLTFVIAAILIRRTYKELSTDAAGK